MRVRSIDLEIAINEIDLHNARAVREAYPDAMRIDSNLGRYGSPSVVPTDAFVQSFGPQRCAGYVTINGAHVLLTNEDGVPISVLPDPNEPMATTLARLVKEAKR